MYNRQRMLSRTEVLNGCVSGLRGHRSFETAYIEPGSLEPKGNQVQKVDKLAEHDAFCRRVLETQVRQLFDQRLNFGGRCPSIEVEPSKDTLTTFDDFCVKLYSRSFEVNRQGNVANRTRWLVLTR